MPTIADVTVNDTDVTRQTLEPGTHAWVEVIPRGVLQPTHDSGLVSVTSDHGAASIVVGSVVVELRAAIVA